MASEQELKSFIGASFRSVWALELLCHLRREAGEVPRDQLVSALRASELVVGQSVESLLAAGLVSISEDGGVRYAPANARLDALVAATEDRYARSPDAVRRMIVQAEGSSINAFLDAFRLRDDK